MIDGLNAGERCWTRAALRGPRPQTANPTIAFAMSRQSMLRRPGVNVIKLFTAVSYEFS
jgi:hypothetical protein